MAHSAGAIYALATALRMPQHIRGRVHLLAPWIPPSQMAPIGITKQDPPPGAQLPKSQRFLRVLPAPFLRVANTGFLSAASSSLSPNGTSTPKREKKRKSLLSNKDKDKDRNDSRNSSPAPINRHLTEPLSDSRRESIMLMDQQSMPDGARLLTSKSMRNLHSPPLAQMSTHQRQRSLEEDLARREDYDSKLTLAIWGLATTNANPAIDLLICLERNQAIGFMYKDITRAVVIHHGSKDTRVPVENVKWLGTAMRRCEVRVLEGEGHGLMASATVMGGVLEEVGREWRDWEEAVRKGERSLGNSRRTSVEKRRR
jgi:pimeloyl-ACP methyl ester carboxylesterase